MPAKEDDPRYLAPNFYYVQEDWLASMNGGMPSSMSSPYRATVGARPLIDTIQYSPFRGVQRLRRAMSTPQRRVGREFADVNTSPRHIVFVTVVGAKSRARASEFSARN